jgi:ubiquinone/menaquinone biosynthesis C-methylase UbiE
VQHRPTPELLDTDSGSPAEIAASISDLRLINRWFGGVATTRTLIQTVARKTGKSEFSLLEVAAGDGSLAQDVRASLQPHGIRLNVTLLDRAPSHLPRSLNSNNNNSNHKESLSSRAKPKDSPSESSGAVEGPAFGGYALVADALALPFPDSTFDLVSCSLFVHHLSPDQVTQFARESLRVCHHAVLINDLIRHPLHLALVYAGMPLYRSRITRHDAPASVRQAYTVEEMREFFQQAGAASVEIQRHYLYRMGVIAWKAKGKPAA